MSVNLLVIDDQSLKTMMTDPRITALLPCLVNARANLDAITPGKPGCGVCANKRASLETQTLNDAKLCVARLRGESLTKLKGFLNARQLRVFVKRTSFTL